MGKEQISRLTRFLKELGCYAAFMKNFNDDINSNGRCAEKLKEELAKLDAPSVIGEAFVWCGTKEGYKFWSVVEGMWTMQRFLQRLEGSKRDSFLTLKDEFKRRYARLAE